MMIRAVVARRRGRVPPHHTPRRRSVIAASHTRGAGGPALRRPSTCHVGDGVWVICTTHTLSREVRRALLPGSCTAGGLFPKLMGLPRSLHPSGSRCPFPILSGSSRSAVKTVLRRQL